MHINLYYITLYYITLHKCGRVWMVEDLTKDLCVVIIVAYW